MHQGDLLGFTVHVRNYEPSFSRSPRQALVILSVFDAGVPTRPWHCRISSENPVSGGAWRELNAQGSSGFFPDADLFNPEHVADIWVWSCR